MEQVPQPILAPNYTCYWEQNSKTSSWWTQRRHQQATYRFECAQNLLPLIALSPPARSGKGSDVCRLIGCRRPDKEMVQSMNVDPIVFALANPNPEISYDDAIAARKDIIFATGRSDHPNQINNVLGFPYIFRGALDVRAKSINEAMKVAAVRAIAELTKSRTRCL